MNNKIINELDSLISYIKDSDDYKEYLLLEEKLSNNKNATSLIKEIKTIQKEIVKKEINKEDITELENKINNNLNELSKIPLYIDFIKKQEYLNELFQLIKERLNNYFNDILN